MNNTFFLMYNHLRNNRIPVCTMLPRRNPVVDRSSLFFANLPGRADLWNTARRWRNRISRPSTCRWLGCIVKKIKQFGFLVVGRVLKFRKIVTTPMKLTPVLLPKSGGRFTRLLIFTSALLLGRTQIR